MRDDISEMLVHFTKGKDMGEAFENLIHIVSQLAIYGSNNKIKDGSRCVCFSETPVSSLKNGLINNEQYSPYSPFGIMTNKEHVFALGGRPVIYQHEDEFEQLTRENSWRHMRYEPPYIDFTWEREWRIKTDRFKVNPEVCKIIVPDIDWAKLLKHKHKCEQRWQTIQFSQIMDDTLASQYEEPFPWSIDVL
ncbi:hypothetical protein TUMSATVNIG1_21910 [Vibrio nigripulchritudo]|uniref:hypothetical protein n=1 Tax=Vibrio nigripulchritudo TaxID=28173 RepID=UPI00190C75D0|nr:hypothetical protein [Vibrio nigripulchritudo]BCL70231.1 hypothetical protein VNTUMSATTG_21680 [Vibrio nigripulchritudo]BDU31582.1 hypothetical protein TUMSATVNIG1_21910 [Vibrio nigripulchritudo]